MFNFLSVWNYFRDSLEVGKIGEQQQVNSYQEDAEVPEVHHYPELTSVCNC